MNTFNTYPFCLNLYACIATNGNYSHRKCGYIIAHLQEATRKKDTLSGRPVGKDEPEPEAAGGDEEVQENRANQVLRDINIYSTMKCKA